MIKVTRQVISLAAALLLSTSVSARSPKLYLPEPQTLGNVTSYTLDIAKTFDQYNVYTTDLKIGSDGQKIQMVLATNTEQTMVTSKNCTVHDDGKNGCIDGIYDATLSNNETIGTTPIYKNLKLGDNWSIVGSNASDVLYTSNGITFMAQNMPIFLITDVSATDGSSFPFQGVLGLSPNVNGDTYTTLGVALPIYMHQQGAIGAAQVGIDMRKGGGSSMTLGTFDQSKFRNTNETLATVPWFDVNLNSREFGWLHNISNFYYGGHSLDDGMPNVGVFDSFWPGIHLPVTEWNYLRANWSSNPVVNQYLNCTALKCGYIGECKDHAEDFF